LLTSEELQQNPRLSSALFDDFKTKVSDENELRIFQFLLQNLVKLEKRTTQGLEKAGTSNPRGTI
jgi:hypothetical protein